MSAVEIDIHVLDEAGEPGLHASRTWAQVPRVGDFVELKRAGMAPYSLAEVIRVHWGEYNGVRGQQRVALICKWKPGT